MSKLCRMGRNWIQIYNCDGDVRECSWTSDGFIGNQKTTRCQSFIMGK